MPTVDGIRSSAVALATVLLTTLAAASIAGAADRYAGIGHTATAAEIAGWNIDVEPDGKNLPAGQGTVAHGHDIYTGQCASCHGAHGEGGIGDRLTGGIGSLNTDHPIQTVGSYWPYATTLFDYIRRAMPQNAPESLSNTDVYSVAGYVLFLNGLLPENATVDAAVLTHVRMPNRDGFTGDPRPDVHDRACAAHCTPVK